MAFFFGFSFCLFSTLLPSTLLAASAQPTLPNIPMLFCAKDRNALIHSDRGQVDWQDSFDAPLFDVQPQPSEGRYLVTGGSKKVFLLRKVWKGCRVVWDWSQLDDVQVTDAVAADWDLVGNPTLILAADNKHNRIFLAEARSNGIKIRWEHALPAEPLKVRICPDTGNFLVLLADSTVQEIDFQKDKVVWTLDPGSDLKKIQDIFRGPSGETWVADPIQGSVFCFNKAGGPVWKTRLPMAPDRFEEMSLSLFKKHGKELMMAAVHFAGQGPKTRDLLYLLNPKTGKLVEWGDHWGKGDFPAFLRAVPDMVAYEGRQP